MRFKAIGLDPEPFLAWHGLNDDELVHARARRRVADETPGFPCRISLEDAPRGERVILLPYEHHAVNSPYRAAGPIFVREHARRWDQAIGVVPPVLRTRLLSVRGYDAAGLMEDADVIPGEALQERIETLFANDRIDYLHVHFARRGCYACRIERA
jgi:hypothetical protein